MKPSLSRRIVRVLVIVLLFLLIPLGFTLFAGMPWTPFDFVAAFVLLFGAGATYEVVASRGSTTAYRAAVAVGVGAGLLLTWVNLAVGIIGSENNPVNLMYFGVLATGMLGASIARFQPRGMAWALLATAVAQMLVPTIALMVVRPTLNEPPGLIGVFMLNLFFAGLFSGSALLFQAAGREKTLDAGR